MMPLSSRQSLLAFLFAACLVQGAFLAPLVANLKHANRRAVRLLALIILCLLPSIGEELVSEAGLAHRYPHTIASAITVDFLIAPLLFFYARSLIDPGRAFRRKDLWHLLPFAVAFVLTIPFLISSGTEKLEVFRHGLPPLLQVVVALKIGVAASYITLIIHQLRRFTRSDDPRAGDPHARGLLWVMFGLAGLAGASVVLGLVAAAGLNVPIESDTLGTLFMCASIFYVSALLIRHPLSALATEGATVATLVIPAPARPKYETSPLDQAQKQRYLDQLIRHMALAKPHLDMELDLESLADALRMRPGHLSQVLNECVGMNFYEFVNSHRVREAQTRLADPAQSGKTMIALAHESGFNSKASFNRAFKRATGQTPSEYARTCGRGAEVAAE